VLLNLTGEFMASRASPLRLAVESVILHKNQVLLMKRAPESMVAPNVWNVPAGKVKLLEITPDAVVRETMEETGIKVKVVKLLCESAFTMKSGEETVYRNMFTYMTTPLSDDPKVTLNEEHTEYTWASKEDLENKKFDSMNERIRKLIDSVL